MNALRKIVFLSLVVALLAGCGAAAVTPTPKTDTATDAWLKAAQLGTYAPAKQDWTAIEAAAKKEGKVLVYANSSRIADVKKLFEAKYPATEFPSPRAFTIYRCGSPSMPGKASLPKYARTVG